MTSPATFQSATSLSQALDLLAESGPEPLLLAGGTDVMVWLQAGRTAPQRVVDIWGVRPECSAISLEDDVVVVGALASYSEIIRAPAAQQHLPLLVAACRDIGAVQIQNRGTLGGNIGGSSPAGDTLPVLLAYAADVVLESRAGMRVVPYASFCTGYRTTVRRPDEMITGALPAGASRSRLVGHALGPGHLRVMLAGCTFNQDGTQPGPPGRRQCCTGTRIAEEVGRIASGRSIDAALIAEVRQASAQAISPIDDVRSTASYRRTVTENLVGRFFADAARTRSAPSP
jgi:CO/xanthine dehydrogenase FAD-binding subunit